MKATKLTLKRMIESLLAFGQTIDYKEIYKVKGLSKHISLTEEDFDSLLNKNNIIIKSQDKWYKSIENATIVIKNQIYTIQQTDNKRELLYNSSNQLIATKPYTITNEKLIH